MPHLALSFLGGFTVRLDGRPLTAFGTDKARALLVYLAAEATHPHRRAALAQLFWPDAPTNRAAHNLRQTLLRVRQALQATVRCGEQGRQPQLLLTRQTIQFNPLADYRLDVATFTKLISAARQHAHEQATTCHVCMNWLAQAAELYCGDFLAGFALRDSPSFDEWQLVQQETFHRQAVEILARLVTYHEDRGEHEQIQRYAGRLVALDPWHEQGRFQLLRALAQGGQIRAAAEQYATYRAALDKEFGMLPSQRIMALQRQIQARQVSAEAFTPALPAQPSPGAGFASPTGERRQITALSCRWYDPAAQDDLEALAEQLAGFEPWLQVLLERYGGYRQQRQGDEWLIYFGYPQDYEDAARRAVQVSLALLDTAGAAYALRIGIHSGMMIVSRTPGPGGAPAPVGDIPAVARSCQGLAAPGAVLLSEATERLVRNWFDCQPLRSQRLAGSARPMGVYQVHRAHENPP